MRKSPILLVAALALLFACTPAEQPAPVVPPQNTTPTNTTPSTPGNTEPEKTEPKTYSFSASPATLHFEGEGGRQSFQLVTEAAWKAYCQEDWVTLSRNAGSGNQTITVTVTANTDTEYDRRATIHFAVDGEGEGSLDYDITQDAGQAEESGTPYLTCFEMPAIDLKTPGSYSESGTETFGSTSWYKYLTTNEKQVVVTHTYEYNGAVCRNWTALIDKDRQSPLWNAFVMHKNAYPNNNIGRQGSWTPDPAVPSNWQRSVASSTFSRGHFVASSYRQACLDANYQTFYYTNQTLQYQNGFNSGMWSALEEDVINHAATNRDTLYVVVGVLFEDENNIITTNQQTQALVASHFYKCLMKCSFDTNGEMTEAKGVAYLFENKKYSGSNYAPYAVSIDEVEKRSGWDFYTNVPKEMQDAAEKSTKPLW